MRTRRSPRNQESMLRIVSGIKDKQSLIMNNAKQRERIAELEAQIAAMRPVVDAAIAFVHQPGGRHYIPESLSPVCKLEDAVRTYEEVKP